MISSILIIGATVILFLFAISKFSQNIQRVAGDRIKKYLSKATSTPLRSSFFGLIANLLAQSNTAVTVTTVGLVDAGLITFRGAFGIIIGSNVGATFTSQLIAFNIIAFAPVFIVVGFLMRRLKGTMRRYSGPVFYFGLLFLSLSYLQLLIKPYISSPEAINIISNMNSIYLSILVGVIATIIFQSSTAISALAITFAIQGVLNFDQAFGIILGSGIGTTLTALIASFVMNASAQRTAISHLIFNITTVTISLILYSPIKSFINLFGTNIGQSIANADILTGIMSATFILIFYNLYVHFIEFIVPDHGFFRKSRAVIINKI
jgi:phosphate:Na+ symporter